MEGENQIYSKNWLLPFQTFILAFPDAEASPIKYNTCLLF